MANLIDMINNPLKEYKIKNNNIYYRYDKYFDEIQYRAEESMWGKSSHKLDYFSDNILEEVLVYNKTALDLFNNENKVYICKYSGGLFKFKDNKIMFKSNSLNGIWIEYVVNLNSFLNYKFAEYNK